MKIDRHNYEEFFILYMDNELNSEEKRQVEAFVSLHPDLKEELDILLQYKMVPDNSVRFEGKEELLKINGNTPVTLTNYGEWFSLYIDHELKPGEQKLVEDFITDNPTLAKELLLLQRTKLQPETIVFSDKPSLYRQEEKRRVVSIRWWKIAAAAILVIGFGFGTYSLLDKKSIPPEVEVAKTIEPGIKSNITEPEKAVKETIVPSNEMLAMEQEVKKQAVRKENPRIKETPNNDMAIENNRVLKDEKVVQVPLQVEEPVIAYSNNLEKPTHNPNFDTKIEKTGLPTALNKQKEPNPALTNQRVTTQAPDPSEDIVTAANRDDGKKNKLRGFFRKVTRTLEKRTNIDATTEDDHLLVAGLAIKLR